MKDQSHKEEMSSLLKADFERLRARGIATTLAPPGEEAPPQEAIVEAPAEPPEPSVEPEPGVEPVQADGWLKRLFRTP